MNTTKYLQTDSRWSELGYPKSPCTIGNSGCGEVSIVNCLIEMQKYVKYTPATIQPYCKKYAAPNCDGTYHYAIPEMMKYYGLTEVKEHQTMPELFKELAKGERVAIYLMGSRKGGSKGVHWTSSGHFVCSTAYKFKDGKTFIYVKDSYSNSKDRNGWITYEENMKGDVLKVWSGKLNGKLTDGTVITDVKGTSKLDLDNSKLKVDGIGGKATILATQKFFGTPQDGVISGQDKTLQTWYPSIQSVEFGKGGSTCVKELQKWLGVSPQDGVIGQITTKAWQTKLTELGYYNSKITGIFGVKSMKAWQECLNNNGAKPDKYKVIDVSYWQGDIDWKKVKADGVKGAIIRYADGDTLDSYFAKNMKEAKANGLHIGAYIFSRAKTKAQAEDEATRIFNACKAYNPDLPLYIDLEAKGLAKTADTVAQAYINKIKTLGGKAGVYANLNWWNTYLTKTAKLSFAMWLAQYNDTMDYKPKGYVGMWQYSSSGKVSGINGNVDMNWLYVDYWNQKPAPKSRTVYIGHAQCNEYGTMSGGKPGDQTGRECCISKWYSDKWLYVYRAKDASIRKKLGQYMTDTCENNNIGYNIDKPNRYAAWDNAEKNGHNIKGISTKGDTTCSQAVSMCMRACGIPTKYAPRHCDIDTLTNVMAKDTEYFKVYTSKEYTDSSAKLEVGDIIINSHHTAIVVKIVEKY